jgi:hypothetical protein
MIPSRSPRCRHIPARRKLARLEPGLRDGRFAPGFSPLPKRLRRRRRGERISFFRLFHRLHFLRERSDPPILANPPTEFGAVHERCHALLSAYN